MSQPSVESADFSSYGLSCVRWIPSPMQRPDHHNEIQINFMPHGRVTYIVGGSLVRIQPGRLTAFWAAIPHQIVDYDSDTEYFVATMPLAWFLQSQLAEILVQLLMSGEVVEEPDGSRAQLDTMFFRQWEQDLRSGRKAITEIVNQEMRLRLQRLALALESKKILGDQLSARRQQINSLNKVEQMVCYIARNYTRTVSANEIGRACGLHPNSAMRLFKRTFGSTLIEHVTHHRIFHAKRLLATTDHKIVDIAFSSGFNSVSRFNDAFRRATGCTPREYRVGHETSDASDERADSDSAKRIPPAALAAIGRS